MEDGEKQPSHDKLLSTRTSLPSGGSLQTFFEYPEKVIKHHPQPSTVDLLKNNLPLSTYYYHHSEYLFSGSLGDNDAHTGDSSSYLPTYDSIFGQFKDDDDGKDRKSDSWLHLKTILTMFFAKLGCAFMLSVMLALPMSMIVIGVTHKDLCPIEPFIPIYLIVAGSFGVIKMLCLVIQRVTSDGDIFNNDDGVRNTTATSNNNISKMDKQMGWMFLDGVLNLFLFTWFVAGNIWVYSKYKPNFTPPAHQPLNYCHRTVYLFAFWVITTSYMVLGMICTCTCLLAACASCTALFLTTTDRNEDEEDGPTMNNR